MTFDTEDFIPIAFFAGVTVIATAWMNTSACNKVVQSDVINCAQACGSSRMSEHDEHGDCRCANDVDAGTLAK